MKIYTRTGDNGTTSLFSGGRVLKYHLRVESYGTLDELNSVIGAARAQHLTPQADAYLEQIQNDLFHLGADLATPLDAPTSYVVRMTAEKTAWLETAIDALTAELAPLKQFVLPGGTPAAAMLHIARTICRRAERLTVELAEQEPIGDHVIPYINRLSDFLFTVARFENLKSGIEESKWSVK